MTNLDFFVLSVSLFAVSQSHTFLSSLLTVASRDWRLLSAKSMFVSSANREKLNFEEEFGISFIYIKKSREPNTEPCGTTQGVVALADTVISTSVVCTRPPKGARSRYFR